MNSKEHEYFNYYCLDKIKPLQEELIISYDEDGLIRKFYYKIGLYAKVKNTYCYILYSEDDNTLENLIYLSQDYLNNNREYILLNILSKSEYMENIKSIPTMNIFEFTSLLNFTYIYDEFKSLIDYNWDTLNMNSLIEM